MKTIKYLFLSAVLIGFTSCNEDEYDYTPDPEPLPALTAGSADFSTYVSLGNSLTSGFTDNALFLAGQQNSFPNTLSQQFSLVGGGSFTQPLMNDNIGGFLFGGVPNPQFGPRLFFNGAGPVPLPATPTTELFAPTLGPQNNMGVPGAKSFHLLFDGYGNPANLSLGLANPYFVRMASSPTATVLGDAMSQSPTFFSLWIGNNDVLGYALSGGESNIMASNYNPITPVETFNASYGALVTTLTSNGAKGVVANIPDVTSIPHFTTVPFNPLSPTNPAFAPQIPVLNATFAPLNQAFAFLGMPERQIVFSETAASAVVIFDETLPNIAAQLNAVLQGGGVDPLTAGLLANQFAQSRQATADDLLVLPVSSVIATVNVEYYTQLVTAGVPAATAGQLSVNGVTYPLRDKWVLLPSEQTEIATATTAFNQTIAATADQAGLARVDANDLLNRIANGGLASGNFILTSALVRGGAFGLDGVHPTARGYALIANEFMKAIDVTYGSNFQASGNLVDIGNYPTNYSVELR